MAYPVTRRGYRSYMMSLLRRLPHEARKMLWSSSKQSLEPLSVNILNKNTLFAVKRWDVINTNYQNSIKFNFHTSSVNRDIEAAIKTVGSGLAMIGCIGPGIGIGNIFASAVSATARNPSLKDQLFIMALLGTAFCETLCLLCFAISIIILYT